MSRAQLGGHSDRKGLSPAPWGGLAGAARRNVCFCTSGTTLAETNSLLSVWAAIRRSPSVPRIKTKNSDTYGACEKQCIRDAAASETSGAPACQPQLAEPLGARGRGQTATFSGKAPTGISEPSSWTNNEAAAYRTQRGGHCGLRKRSAMGVSPKPAPAARRPPPSPRQSLSTAGRRTSPRGWTQPPGLACGHGPGFPVTTDV